MAEYIEYTVIQTTMPTLCAPPPFLSIQVIFSFFSTQNTFSSLRKEGISKSMAAKPQHSPLFVSLIAASCHILNIDSEITILRRLSL